MPYMLQFSHQDTKAQRKTLNYITYLGVFMP